MRSSFFSGPLTHLPYPCRAPVGAAPFALQGFEEACLRGPLLGNPVWGVRFVLEDGAYHQVDSNELAFRVCAAKAFAEAFSGAGGTLLQPIMKVGVCPRAVARGARGGVYRPEPFLPTLAGGGGGGGITVSHVVDYWVDWQVRWIRLRDGVLRIAAGPLRCIRQWLVHWICIFVSHLL